MPNQNSNTIQYKTYKSRTEQILFDSTTDWTNPIKICSAGKNGSIINKIFISSVIDVLTFELYNKKSTSESLLAKLETKRILKDVPFYYLGNLGDAKVVGACDIYEGTNKFIITSISGGQLDIPTTGNPIGYNDIETVITINGIAYTLADGLPIYLNQIPKIGTVSTITTTFPITLDQINNVFIDNPEVSTKKIGENYIIQLENKTLGINLSGITGTASNDIITYNAHGLNDGDYINIVNLTGGTGLTIGNNYYVVNSTTNTFQLALTSSGLPINFTTNISAGIIVSNDYKEGMYLKLIAGTITPVTGKVRVICDLEDF